MMDKETILAKELLLLNADIRTDAERLKTLLDESFMEFTSSGGEYRFSPGDTFGPLQKPAAILTDTFRVRDLGAGVVLALYQTEENGRKVNRSSIWRLAAGEWKICFHQGTPAVVSDQVY